MAIVKKFYPTKLDNTMFTDISTNVLKQAINKYPKPSIFNSDQGSQYTSNEHTAILKKSSIDISINGKGASTDNICVERFFRSLKYEHIYPNRYKTFKEVKEGIKQYMKEYNTKRLHSSLNYKTPNDVYNSKCLVA